MSLDTDLNDALARLAGICTVEATGFEHVYLNAEDSYPVKPCLVVADIQFGEERNGGGERNISVDLTLQSYISRADLGIAHEKTRSAMAKLFIVLGDDITLGGHCNRTQWLEPAKVVQIEDGNAPYVGLEGIYRLWFKVARDYRSAA